MGYGILYGKANLYLKSLAETLNKLWPKINKIKLTKNDIPFGYPFMGETINIRISDIVKMGMCQEIITIVKKECEKLFNTARIIRQSTEKQEDPSILEGLI